MATETAPRDWWDETDETLATVLDVLEKNADRIKKQGRRRRG